MSIILLKSTRPVRFDSLDGMLINIGSTFNLFFIELVVVSTVAPSLSSLLMKPSLGTSNLLAYIHTVSLYVSTPIIPSKIVTAPSQTRRDLSTSAEKSTWPGVSMRLI